jgi:hypothetical protein
LESIGVVPDLTGQRCERLICQEFWYAGELSAPVNVLFLRANGAWHRFFFDAGVLFWRSVDAPDQHDTTEMDEFHYPHADIGGRHGISGRRILGLARGQDGAAVWLRIDFAAGLRLLVSNHDDVSRLDVGPGIS